MFDHGDNRDQGPAFSLDRKDIARAKLRRKLSRKELRFAVLLPVLLLLMGWAMYEYLVVLAQARNAPAPAPAHAALAAMARPLYDALPPLPSESEIAAQRPAAAALVAEGRPVPLTSLGLDPVTVAWAEARLAADRAVPPMPQRVGAQELVMSDHVPMGTALICEGRLEDRLAAPVAGGGSWQRLLLALDAGQYAEVLSDAPEAAEVAIGRQVRVVGRLLGYNRLATAQGQVDLPMLLGRLVGEAVSAAPDERLAEFHRGWTGLPEQLYEEVDDSRLWVETRPYYYLLGQVLRDRTTPGALDQPADGNFLADDVHLRPAEFRGRPFRVIGTVYMAWEDREVAADRPFGVTRVARVLMWARDLAPITERIDGKDVRSMRLVLRLYEFAAITDQPLPEPGTRLQAVGRFLKKRAIAVKTDPARDRANQVQRRSDRVYPWMYVTGPWTVVPDEPAQGDAALAWFIVGTSALGLIVGLVWWWREVRHADRRLKPHIAAVRANRQRLRGGKDAAAPPPAEPPPAAPPPAASPPPDGAP